MKWKNISEMVGKAAPMLGTAIGGPAGAALGSLVANVLGVDNTPEAVAEAIRNDPDALLKLKQLELDNEQSIREHAFKVLDVELKDTQSARNAHKDSKMPAFICAALTLMVFIGGYALFTASIPEQNENIANILFGNVLGYWGSSLAYWVGTTRSSSQKTSMLGQKQ
jgi:hypothetical protein